MVSISDTTPNKKEVAKLLRVHIERFVEKNSAPRKQKAENAYAEDAESYLVAKGQKRKNIAKIVKAEKAKGIVRR